jgi:uncharacterized protein YkwD
MRTAALTIAVVWWGALGVGVSVAQGQVPSPPSALDVPQILSVGIDQPKAPGEPSNVRVRAVDQQAPVSGAAALFPGGDAFGISACRAPDSSGRMPGQPFAPESKVTFSLPHDFTAAQGRAIFLRLDSSACGGVGQTTFGNFSFDSVRPAPRKAQAAAAPPVAIASQGCRGSGARVGRTRGQIRAARHSLLCLLNGLRRSRGLRPLRSNRRLSRAASGHSRFMVRAAFFSHVGPGGIGLVQRVRRAGYLSGTHSWLVGENIGFGIGRVASPAGMVRSWMGSTPHRANILSGSFHEIGLGVAPGIPGRPGRGATYTTDFGMRR